MGPLEQERFVDTELNNYTQTLCLDDPCLSDDVRRVLRYIHAHLFEESLSMQQVLKQCHIRSHSFNARFKFELFRSGWGRTTIWTYIQQQRVEAAKRLLEHEGIELFLIAVRLGFRHYETFTRVFRRYANESPSAFRNRLTYTARTMHRA